MGLDFSKLTEAEVEEYKAASEQRSDEDATQWQVRVQVLERDLARLIEGRTEANPE
jgi:hypothetical protein